MEKERYYSLYDYGGSIEVRDRERGKTIHSLFELDDLLNQQDKRIKELELLLNADKKMKTTSIKGFEKLKQENQQLKEENGYIVFVDGYDKNGDVVHKQKFVKYKDTCKELIKENRKLKHLPEIQKGKMIMVYYVIKNSENKFFAHSALDYSHYWTTIVDFAYHFYDLPGHSAIDEAIKFRNNNYPDCKVVKIEISEKETGS